MYRFFLLFVSLLTFGVLVCPVQAQTNVNARPTPVATYRAEVRVLGIVDDVLDGVSYQRARLSVVSVTAGVSAVGAPPLGAGTTVTAIVRDEAARAILRSVNTSLTLGATLGWFGESTFEVIAVDEQPASAVTAATPGIVSKNSELILFLAVAVLGGLVLVGVRRMQHAS